MTKHLCRNKKGIWKCVYFNEQWHFKFLKRLCFSFSLSSSGCWFTVTQRGLRGRAAASCPPLRYRQDGDNDLFDSLTICMTAPSLFGSRWQALLFCLIWPTFCTLAKHVWFLMIQTFTLVVLYSNTFITLFYFPLYKLYFLFFLLPLFSIVVMAIFSPVRCILSALQTLKKKTIHRELQKQCWFMLEAEHFISRF